MRPACPQCNHSNAMQFKSIQERVSLYRCYCCGQDFMINEPNNNSVGIKHDQDKPRPELLSSIWIEGVSNVLAYGAKKYDEHNWRKGISYSRLLGACLRHVFAFLRGEDNDPETGYSHLFHASCCLMFLSELHTIKQPGNDDRFKIIKGTE